MGATYPQQDLIEYLDHELSITFAPMDEQYRQLRPEDIAELYDEWRQFRRRREWMDEAKFERLVMHDTRSLLLVDVLRARDVGSNQYASSWWWLTIDRGAHRRDEARRKRGPLRCMSPDFFARFLSLRPKSGADDALDEKFPISVEIGSLDLVPNEMRDEALAVLDSSAGEPEYLRRRKIRDLVYEAKSVRGEILEGGLSDVVEAIEDSLLRPADSDGSQAKTAQPEIAADGRAKPGRS